MLRGTSIKFTVGLQAYASEGMEGLSISPSILQRQSSLKVLSGYGPPPGATPPVSCSSGLPSLSLCHSSSGRAPMFSSSPTSPAHRTLTLQSHSQVSELENEAADTRATLTCRAGTCWGKRAPSTTIAIIFVGSCSKTLYRPSR